MYIAKVLSNLGAWNSFQVEHPEIHAEICKIIDGIDLQRTHHSLNLKRKEELLFSPIDLSKKILSQLEQHKWTNHRITFGSDPKSGFSRIDGLKEKIGIDVSFGKFAFAESDLFVKFPLFIRAEIINSALLVLPMRSLTQEMSSGINSFEMIEHRLKEISPLLPRYPFAIIGITHNPSQLATSEFSSHLDQYLSQTIGSTLLDLKLSLERPNCDFKEMLSEKNDKIAKAICAFANLPNGGILLIGVNNAGDVVGIPQIHLDTIRERISNINRDSCKPIPTLDFQVFELGNIVDRCVLTVYVSSLSRKPCMFDGRVFIRDGTSAVQANSDQIRNLVLGSEI
jgi:hypothetical protein